MPSPGPLLRRLLLGLGALVALLGLAALALPLVIDANAFRPQIEQVVAGRFKRMLSINGDLRLSVFPRLAVVLPKTTLSERESDRTFARLEQARIGVALWPLLAGRFEAGAIEITGLDATIERRADGSTSIDDLIGRGALQRADPPGRRDDGSAPAHAVAGLELVDARLTLIDGGRRVLTVFSLDLSTGPLAPKASSPVKLAMAFSAPQVRAQGALALDGTLEVNSAAGSLGVRSLRLGARGDIASAGLEVNMSGSRLELKPAFRGEKLKLTFLSADASDPYLTIDIDEVVGTIERLRAGSVRISTDQRRGQRTIAARLVSTAEASLMAQTLQLTELAGDVTIGNTASPDRLRRLSVAGTAEVNATQQTAALILDAKFDDTALHADIDIAGFAQPKVRFDLHADRLDADQYLPAPGAADAMVRTGRNGPRLDLAALRGVDLAGQAHVGELRLAGIRAVDVRFGVRVADNRIDLAPLAARLYGGSLSGSAFAAAEGSTLGVNATLEGVAIGPLLRDAGRHDLVTGTADIRLDATMSAGSSPRALSGAATLRLRDGAIKGLDLARRLREAGDLLRLGRNESQRADAAQLTEFTELSASFTLADGVARNGDLAATAAPLRLAGGGTIDLAAGSIDYTLRATVIGPLRGTDGRDLAQLRGLDIPVHLSGPLDHLSCDIRWAAVAPAVVSTSNGKGIAEQ